MTAQLYPFSELKLRRVIKEVPQLDSLPLDGDLSPADYATLAQLDDDVLECYFRLRASLKIQKALARQEFKREAD